MQNTDVLAIMAFPALFALMMLRVPIGIAMGIVGVAGFASVVGLGPAMSTLSMSPLRTATDFNLSLIPFFVLMGVLATRSGLSRELFRAGDAWFGFIKGGMAISTIGACGGFAAISGSSAATAATMTKIALPEMRRAGYPGEVAAGVVAAGGTLGILIPPSVMLAVYGYMTEQDIGKLFIAGLIPGLLAVVMYMVAVRLAYGRRLPDGRPFDLRKAIVSLSGVWAVMLLFLSIVVSIYFGLTTPTEAAAVGAFLTAVIGFARGRLTPRILMSCLVEGLRTSVAIYTILIGAILFGYFLAVTQTPQKITAWLVALELGSYGTLALILGLFLVLGCIMDGMAMVILLVPIVYPVVVGMGFDPIWFGILVVVTVELGLITPPVGMNVFVINSLARDINLVKIFRGVLPFVAADVVRLIILILFPALALWLPMTMP
ncbi:TRAP transporter large permease [Aquibium carbonis]|uniref:TRAP transporter large permease protein n=1 Tax=Aquibium carbonis TaxID=2495581 RepID=A0A429YU96_9HYPH|nr:TRAP transporter large permease [Aquibium carbonis]RST85028.1 TRAP transporter large permease [Aquibium carbonis]